ncbi:S1 family peptidase [Rhodovulum euryhalinum]|uniref:Trypsin-like peptidase n=1 Tax=Rhodovulum euryhalinum TaxID=35805 RepID=A0A4R2KJM3_9RHOB|nr:serine protease [Rhodovulum euryhalinum]TCO70786.1 trypsin-like peptidase [Rhodovulum euryhalinum]
MRKPVLGTVRRGALCAAVGAGCLAAPAHAIEDTIVYVECTATDGTTRRGTGVVVSPEGHVLTAKHVVPDGADCRGKIGVADSNNAERMILQPFAAGVDAALLRFARQGDYAFAGYCELEPWMVRKRIVVAGFPGGSRTGVPSYREGILSTVVPTAQGVLETDGQTVAGMSGGPVFSRNLAGLVGTVVGADFARDGTVSYYGILPASLYAGAFGLTPAERPCYHEYREIDLTDPETEESIAVWRAGDGPRHLGVYEDEGFCFIEAIWGEWNHPSDEVGVWPQDGEYVIRGENFGGGTHGATARCIVHE